MLGWKIHSHARLWKRHDIAVDSPDIRSISDSSIRHWGTDLAERTASVLH